LGNGGDSIATFVKELFSKMNLNFEDFDTMIYGDGPVHFWDSGWRSFP
jgi:hypothetical protein